MLRAMLDTGGSRGEVTEYPTMIRMMEGHEVFGPLQLRRIDYKHEMFKEEEALEREQGEAGQTRGRRRAVDSLWKWTTRGRAQWQKQ